MLGPQFKQIISMGDKLMSRQLRTLSKTYSIRLSTKKDHRMPRKLFQEIFNAYLPQISILTKTQQKKVVVRDNTALIKKKAAREQRWRKLQMPKKTTLIPLVNHSIDNSHSPSMRKTSKFNRNSLGPSRRSQYYIYKSEMRSLQSTYNPQSTQSVQEANKPQQILCTFESDESLEDRNVAREIEIVSSKKSSHRQRYHLDITGREATFLRRIFDAKGYEQKFQEINNNLLKKDRVYRSKDVKLETKEDWRI